jgi:hypothetical protein
MNRAKIKYAPAIKDMTVEHDKGNDDEGMEAVLCPKNGRRRQQQQQQRSKQIEERSSHSSSVGDSIIYETPQNVELLDLIENKDWEKLIYRLLKQPHIAHVKFTGRSLKSTSAGNLVLHEICKHNAPIDVIEAFIEANHAAITTKGHWGYLPYHCACANGASIELVRYLYSLHPDAVRQVEEEGNALPLHLALKMGTTKEDVYMNLLTSYPEGVRIRDDFDNLPMDYAKSIRSDVHRKIAIECLHRARWLESAAKRSSEHTESEYQKRIRGYEQFQAQQLKMIEEVHKKEIHNLELVVESQKEELSEQSKDIEELEHQLQKRTDEFHDQIESLEKSMKNKGRRLQGQIDRAKKESTQSQVALDLKKGELIEVTNKLEQANKLNKSTTQQLEQRTEDIELALDDIDTLNRHSEWLESVLGSIRNLSNTESPLIRNIQRKDENQSLSTFESAAQSGSGRIRTSIVGRDSISSSMLVKSCVRGGVPRKPARNKDIVSDESSTDKRDASLVGRVIESRRE